jgi:hypothetical protein
VDVLLLKTNSTLALVRTVEHPLTLYNKLNIQRIASSPPWDVCGGSADWLEIIAPDWDNVACIELDDHGAAPTDKQRANADIISKAPEMLRLLLWAGHTLDYHMNQDDEMLPEEFELEAEIRKLVKELDGPYTDAV